MSTMQEMHAWLLRVAYPATPEEMAETLRQAQAPEEAVTRVLRLPAQRYGSVDATMDALRGMA